jgi:hypothetical protein
MSEVKYPESAAAESPRTRWMRVVTYGLVALQGLLLIYLFVYIGQHSNPMGDGMEWVAVVPAIFLTAIGTLPALAVSASKRLMPAAVLLACVGVLLNGAFFLEVAREFAESASP